MSYANVHLDCRNSAASPGNGYKTTTSSIGTSYSYAYSGGTDGKGGVTFTTGSGVSVLELSVGGDPRYQVESISFSGSDTSDLSWTLGSNSTQAFIIDTDINDLDDEYSILVRDTVANCTFPCDPPIKNVPG